jgi:hypothetical protein
VFVYPETAPLRVVVSAGGGHRAEVRISAQELERNAICASTACLMPSPSPTFTASILVPVAANVQQTDGSSSGQELATAPLHSPNAVWGTVWASTIGVGVLMAVAAVFALRNARRRPRSKQETPHPTALPTDPGQR